VCVERGSATSVNVVVNVSLFFVSFAVYAPAAARGPTDANWFGTRFAAGGSFGPFNRIGHSTRLMPRRRPPLIVASFFPDSSNTSSRRSPIRCRFLR